MIVTVEPEVEQVLMNLVVNARDAMPNGGEIRVETEAVTLTAPLERDRAKVPAGDWVTIRVSDEGVGIDPDKMQKVFEPFYTTSDGGNGLGLYVCRQLCQANQATLDYEDAQPGARFVLTCAHPDRQFQ